MNDVIKVGVIEDDGSVRRALERLLASAGFSVAGYGSAEDFLAAPDCRALDCIVADVQLPRINGLQLQTELKRIAPAAALVFITGHGDLSVGMRAMKEGAVDFLEKPVDDKALIGAIRTGAERCRRHRIDYARQAELQELFGSLSKREREVFALITQGLLNKQVGYELGTTERTVKAHRARVTEKMGAESLADLVRMAEVLRIHDAT
jgi:FixJ family two-component response regulator